MDSFRQYFPRTNGKGELGRGKVQTKTNKRRSSKIGNFEVLLSSSMSHMFIDYPKQIFLAHIFYKLPA